MQSEKRKCANPDCKKYISADAHDNRRYCSRQCKLNNDARKNRENYIKKKEIINVLQETEQDGKITTSVNGKEMKYYDAFKLHLESLEKAFVECERKIAAIPMLPENYPAGFDLYEQADEKQRAMIFVMLYQKTIECLRHWTVDRDLLYYKKGRKKHAKFLKSLGKLQKYMKDGWESFGLN
jgi:hypothetical protein